MRTRLLLPVIFSILSALALPGQAQAPDSGGNILFKNVAEVEVEVKGPDGKVSKRRQPVATAIPGTEVIYTSTFRNTGTKPAGKIVVNNPIPKNTTLVPGSAFGESTDITYSADGGKTFASPARVTVKGADGKERPAGVSEFTNILWTYRGELAPGKEGVVGFRVVIN